MNSLFEVEGKEVSIRISNQYVLTSADCLISSDDSRFYLDNNVRVQGVILRQTRPRNWDIKGWFRLFKEIKKYMPVDDKTSRGLVLSNRKV